MAAKEDLGAGHTSNPQKPWGPFVVEPGTTILKGCRPQETVHRIAEHSIRNDHRRLTARSSQGVVRWLEQAIICPSVSPCLSSSGRNFVDTGVFVGIARCIWTDNDIDRVYIPVNAVDDSWCHHLLRLDSAPTHLHDPSPSEVSVTVTEYVRILFTTGAAAE